MNSCRRRRTLQRRITLEPPYDLSKPIGLDLVVYNSRLQSVIVDTIPLSTHVADHVDVISLDVALPPLHEPPAPFSARLDSSVTHWQSLRMSSNVHPSIAISSADQPVRHDHPHRRVLVGPLPETVIAHTVKKKKSLPSTSSQIALNGEGEDVPEVVKNNAFNFFIRRGGRAEEWGENEERGVKEEMLRRWKDTEWAAVWSSRKRKDASSRGAGEASHKWVGGSFEIGEFLGADILKDIDDRTEGILKGDGAEGSSAPRRTHRRSLSGSQVTPQGPPPIGFASVAHDTSSLHAAASGSRLNDTLETSSFDSSSQRHSGPVSSDTYLLRSSAEQARPNHLPESRTLSEPGPRPPPRKSSILSSDGSKWFDRKGKGKHVRYAEPETLSPVSELPEGNGGILGNAAAGTSTIPEPVQSPKCDGDQDNVIMKGSFSPTLFLCES